MKQEFFNLEITTNGQKLYEFTNEILAWIKKNNFKDGILNLSIQHTSASLIIQENADPDVQTDLINYFNKLVPMNKDLYIHSTEGKDDMPAHIKSSLTNNQITLSIKKGELILGTWQGLYLFEHRLAPQSRKILSSFFRKLMFNLSVRIISPL
jgi:secondary thiamine-phosphate synthase enzyme